MGMGFNQEFLDIVSTTLQMAFASTSLSAIIGIPLGLWLERTKNPIKKYLVTINRTLMSMPPVVAGLIVYLLLMRNGVFGAFGLLFTVTAMVIAQMLIITPIISGMVYTVATAQAENIYSFAHAMGANKWQTLKLLIKELGNDFYFIIIASFGRALSEVGAVMIAGGNIRFRTRTMTTSITMLRNQGELTQGIYLGVLLLLIALLLQLMSNRLMKRGKIQHENT